MIRRALAGTLALFLSLGLSLASFYVVREKGRRLISAAESALFVRYDDMENRAGDMLTFWKENRKLFFALLKHSDADALSLSFDRLSTALERGDREIALECVSEIRAEMRAILDGETPGIGNIF